MFLIWALRLAIFICMCAAGWVPRLMEMASSCKVLELRSWSSFASGTRVWIVGPCLQRNNHAVDP